MSPLPNKYSLPSNFLACQHTNKFTAYSAYFEEIHKMINDMCVGLNCEPPRWFKYIYKKRSKSLTVSSFRIFYNNETGSPLVGETVLGTKSKATLTISGTGIEGTLKYIEGSIFTGFLRIGEPITFGGKSATIIKIRGTGWSSSKYSATELKNGAAINTVCYTDTNREEIITYVNGIETKILMREEYLPFVTGYQIKSLPCFDDFINRAGFTLDQFMNHILDYEYITDIHGNVNTNIINTFYLVRDANGPVVKVGGTVMATQNLKDGLERVKNYSWDLILAFASWSGFNLNVDPVTSEFGGKHLIDTRNTANQTNSRGFRWETTDGNDWFSDNTEGGDSIYKTLFSKQGRFPTIYDLATDFPVYTVAKLPSVVPYFVDNINLYDFYETPVPGYYTHQAISKSYLNDYAVPPILPLPASPYKFPVKIITGGSYLSGYNDEGRLIDFPHKNRYFLYRWDQTWNKSLYSTRGVIFPYDSIKSYEIYGTNNLKAAADYTHQDWILLNSDTFPDVDYRNRTNLVYLEPAVSPYTGNFPPLTGLTSNFSFPPLSMSDDNFAEFAYPSVGLYPNDWPHNLTVPPAYVNFLTNKTAVYPTNVDLLNQTKHNIYQSKSIGKQYCYYMIKYIDYYSHFDIREIWLDFVWPSNYFNQDYEGSVRKENGPDYPSCVVLPKVEIKNGNNNIISPVRYFQLLKTYGQTFLLTSQAKFILKTVLNTFIRDYLLNLDVKTYSVFENYDDLENKAIGGSPITNFAAELITMFRTNEWLLTANASTNTASSININAFLGNESIAESQIINWQFIDQTGSLITSKVRGINRISSDGKGYDGGYEILFDDNLVRRFDKNLNILPVNGSSVFSRSPNANEFIFTSNIANIPIASYDNAIVGNNFSKSIYVIKNKIVNRYSYDSYNTLDLAPLGRAYSELIRFDGYDFSGSTYHTSWYCPHLVYFRVINIEEDGLYEFACYNQEKNSFKADYLITQDNNKVFHHYPIGRTWLVSPGGANFPYIGSGTYYSENGGFVRGGLRLFCLDSSFRYVEQMYVQQIGGVYDTSMSWVNWNWSESSRGGAAGYSNSESIGITGAIQKLGWSQVDESGVLTLDVSSSKFVDRGPGIYYGAGGSSGGDGIKILAWDSRDVLAIMSQKKETVSMSGGRPVFNNLTVSFFDTIAPLQVNLVKGKYLCLFLEDDTVASLTYSGNPAFITGYNNVHGSSRKLNTVCKLSGNNFTYEYDYGGAVHSKLVYEGDDPLRFYYRKIA